MEAASRFELENDETRVSQALYSRLLEVHGVLRSDLATVQGLIDGVGGGMTAEQIAQQLDELQTKSPLWQLKINCLQFCTLLHGHHTGEDTNLFPRLREANPEIAPAVARLEADHEQVSQLLEEIESIAGGLIEGDSLSARDQLADRLGAMKELLDEHLEYEEAIAGPTIRRLVSFG